MQTQKHRYVTAVFVLAFLFGIVEIRFVRADTIIVNNSSSVITNTSVKAESGGNSNSSGRDGKSSATVTSRTVVNGEVVESFERTVTGASGTPAKIEYEKTYATSSGSGNVRVYKSIQAGGAATEMNKSKASRQAMSLLGTASTTATSASSTASTSQNIGSTTETVRPQVAKSLWSRMWHKAGSLLRNIFIF